MKIVHLSTFDSSVGAAIATYRLHKGLQRLGVESTMFVLDRRGNDPSVIAFHPPMELLARIWRRWQKLLIERDFCRYAAKRPTGCELFSDDRSEHGAAVLRQLPQGDIINLHWVARLIDYCSFFAQVPQHTPLVWRLADMNPLTGGCHYDDGCGKFTHQCGACPQLGSRNPADLAFQIWRRKYTALRQVAADRLHIVTTSRWMQAEVQRSALLCDRPVTIIPNGLDANDFRPYAKRFARQCLELPLNARIVLFTADNVTNQRKGLRFLIEALARLEDHTDLLLLTMGRGEFSIDLPVAQRHLGYIASDERRALVYSAADIFVTPALQEAFGQTVIEAMACGTPVVAFAVGGILDMVRPGITGLLASAGDVAALCAAIATLLNDAGLRAQMAQHCRRIVLEEYTIEVQARQYQALYQTILSHTQR